MHPLYRAVVHIQGSVSTPWSLGYLGLTPVLHEEGTTESGLWSSSIQHEGHHPESDEKNGNTGQPYLATPANGHEPHGPPVARNEA